MSELKAVSDLRVGDEIHGFANGFFGRDSYACRVVEAVGRDWIVTRNKYDRVEFAKALDQRWFTFDAMDRSYCDGNCKVELDD